MTEDSLQTRREGPDVPIPARATPWLALGCLAILAGFPWSLAVSTTSLKLWSGAASDCEVFEAGDRFGVTLFIWPTFTIVLIPIFALCLLVVGRSSWIKGLLLAMVVTGAIGLMVVASTGSMIRADPDGAAECPTGIPDWWPPWLPK
jgi:hypothetical protein